MFPSAASPRQNPSFGPLPTLADRAIAVMARQSLPRTLSYSIAVVMILASAALQTLLPLYRVPYLLLIPAIFLIGLMFGPGEGLVATVLAAVLADYLFMGPRPGFQGGQPAVVTSILFALFSSFIVMVCGAVRRSALRLSIELDRSRSLRASAEAAARALETSEDALRRLNERLKAMVEERTAALDETQEALRQSQKMEALGQLTGGVAHDFNNLLAGVVGALELAGSRLDQGRLADVHRYLDMAHDAARRGAALTRRLLAFSRRQALTLESVDLAALVEGMAELIRRTVGPGVTLSIDAPSACWTTRSDRSQLENALLNLAINARDAMGGRGRLSVRLANHAIDPSDGALRQVDPGDYVRLSVADTGCGMSPEVAARAFEPFFTTKPPGEGTGLGLSMIYAFARQAGGSVWIETAPGEGACINLLLPRDGPAAVAASAPGEIAPVADGRGQTVLLVEDEPAIRAVVTEALQAAGYVAVAAEDGAACLDLLGRLPRVDLLICDLGLPGDLNGRQVFEAARRLRPSLEALFITGYAEAEVAAMLEPGMARLAKPFEMEALQRVVGRLLRG
jgi:signal transduction histidine kinase/CheY-like chemotaxis protein